MLARLDATPGVVRSEVDASGKRFRLLSAPGADAAAIVEAARLLLGASVREAEGDAAPAEEPIAGLGGRWFAAADALALTRIEARLYRLRIVTSAVREGLLRSPRDAKALGEAAGAELNAALLRAEEAGHVRGDWFTAQWRTLWPGIVERCRAQLDPGDVGRLSHWFATAGGPGYVIDRGSADFMDTESARVKSSRKDPT